MTIDSLLALHPPTNPNWANEVGFHFFAEDIDLVSDGWKDPWGRPISQSMFSQPVLSEGFDGSPHKWFEQHCYTSVEDTLIPMTVFINAGKK